MKKIDPKAKQRHSSRKSPSSPMSNESVYKADGVGFDLADVLAKVAKNLRKNQVARPQRHKGEAEPVFSSEPLISYKYDPKLGRNERVVVTVKTTLQVHKNDRQEEQMKRPTPEVFGREAARRYVPGFVAAFSLSHDRLDWSLRESEWAFSALEPYAIDVYRDVMALSGGNYVWLIDINTGEIRSCRHPWLSQAHTAQFSTDGTRLLVASAGFDAIFEFDIKSAEVVWEWFAWDHGFERSQLGHYVVRSAERNKALKALEQEVLFVEDPRKFEFGIPTRLCPTHLNSACYDLDGNILVTLFHQGTGIIIDKMTGEARTEITGMVNPHKLLRRNSGGYFVSDTRGGKLILMDERGRRVREISLTNMPGLERSDLLSEFLQNTTELKNDLFASIDIHRNSLWLIDAKRRRYRGIKFPVEWSMHDITSLPEKHCIRIGRLVGTTFGKVEAIAQGEKIIRHFSPEGSEIAILTLDKTGRHIGLDFQM
jgi:hypothetical protein